MSDPSWGTSIPFLFDLRADSTWLVCVECLNYSRDISDDAVAIARYWADQHVTEVHPNAA